MVAVEIPEEPAIEPEDIIGIDMGIVNIAVDSTGKYYSGDRVREVREHNADLRSRLQSVRTKSAKRHLKKLSGKESRFARNTNHVISKEIVAKAKGTSLQNDKAAELHAHGDHLSLFFRESKLDSIRKFQSPKKIIKETTL